MTSKNRRVELRVDEHTRLMNIQRGRLSATFLLLQFFLKYVIKDGAEEKHSQE